MIKLILAAWLLVVGTILCSYGREWRPPDEAIGVWTGKAEVFADFKKDEYPSKNPADWFEIRLDIRPDGKVNDRIGDARLVGCRIKKNRGRLGRLLNLRSDYIVCGGVLRGPVVPEDRVKKRHFTIPFNIVDGTLTGGFMVLQQWKYPYPMFPRVRLKKNDEGVRAPASFSIRTIAYLWRKHTPS